MKTFTITNPAPCEVPVGIPFTHGTVVIGQVIGCKKNPDFPAINKHFPFILTLEIEEWARPIVEVNMKRAKSMAQSGFSVNQIRKTIQREALDAEEEDLRFRASRRG